jgi:LL-diaminopimelate aminotransferase
MAKINPYYAELKTPYIFPLIEEKLAQIEREGLKEKVINLSIGDIALPLADVIADAICQAAREMTSEEGKRGYPPSEGYSFLRKAIWQNEYSHHAVTEEEIFISDGANSDTSNIQELFSVDAKIVIIEPTYPVYLSTNIMAGRKEHILLISSTEANDFVPLPPNEPCDLIFLCSPNNPTGVAMNRGQLQAWVNYALEHQAIIVFDHTYCSFIRSQNVPYSIYEIPGAERVAIECKSFSKSAGFTGLRCAYAVVPKELPHNLHAMWRRRQSTKSNGVAYPIQRGAEAIYTEKGKLQTEAQVAIYLESARILREALEQAGQTFVGGLDAPYIWWKVAAGRTSWQFFDHLLQHSQILGIPGVSFGSSGEGYLRLSTFTTPEKACEAAKRIESHALCAR